jgi:hypothetical protein
VNSTTVSAAARPMPSRRALAALGPVVVFAIAWASTAAHSTMAVANVALVLAIVTVGVAMVTWAGGLVTSAVAALSLNYFHTEPVHSLRITESDDLLAVFLLAALGVTVSAITALRVRSAARDHHQTVAAGVRGELAAASLDSRPVATVWAEAVRASCAGLALVDCRVEATGATTLPAVSRQRAGVDQESTMFVLPEGGAVMTFRDPRLGQVVLAPRQGMGALELDRRAVTAFVDQLELALTSASSAGSAGSTVSS